MHYHSYERHTEYIVSMLDEGQDEVFYNHLNKGVCQVGGLHPRGKMSFLRDLTNKELQYLSTYMAAYFGTPTTDVLEIEELLMTQRPTHNFAWQVLEFYLPSRIYHVSLADNVVLVLDEVQSRAFVNKHEATNYFNKLMNERQVQVRDDHFNLMDTFNITLEGEDTNEDEIDQYMSNEYNAVRY